MFLPGPKRPEQTDSRKGRSKTHALEQVAQKKEVGPSMGALTAAKCGPVTWALTCLFLLLGGFEHEYGPLFWDSMYSSSQKVGL